MDILITILSLFCLASVFITFGLGIAAYSKDPQSSVNRIFLLLMCSVSYWAFGEFMIWQAGSPEGAAFWLKASFLWPFVFAFTLHFILIFTKSGILRRYPILSLGIIYLPTAITSILLLFTNWIYTAVSDTVIHGCTYLPVRESMAYQAVAVYLLLMMLLAAGILYTFWRQAPTPKIKSQAKLLCTGLLIAIFFGVLSGIVLPAFLVCTPNLIFIGIVIFSLTIAIAVQKHELFVLSPTTVVPDILRTMPDAMILADIQGTIISTNESAVRFIGSDSSVTGRSIADYLEEEVFTYLRQTLLETGVVTDIETVPAGTPSQVVNVSGSLVRDPQGEPVGMVLIVRDITDRIAAENSLRAANRKISLLSQITRHDINNMLSALAGYLLLLKDHPDDPENDSYLTACMEIVEKISNHLRFTREYQEIGSNQPIWVRLENAFSDARKDITPGTFRISQDLLPSEIYADPMIVKVFYNILENAIRHGKSITHIRISAGPQEDGSLRILIADDGVGVSTDDKEKIFQYGFGKNTGLGLAVSRDILSLTGMTIRETGEHGAGAWFEIIVPPSSWRRNEQ